MAQGGVKTLRSFGRRIKDNDVDITRLYQMADARNTVQQIQSAPRGAAVASGTQGHGQALLKGGDAMIGPIAYLPALINLTASEDIDIGKGTDFYTSRIILANSGAFNLENILNPEFNGQILFLQGVESETINIVTTGNIETIDDMTFTLNNDDIIMFQFDSTDNKWQQITTGDRFGLDLTTKGDLHTYTTDDARLPVGATDGFSLLVNAASSAGITWGYADRLEEGNSSVEVIDSGVGQILNIVDGETILNITNAVAVFDKPVSHNSQEITEILRTEFTQIGSTTAGDLMIMGDAGGIEINVPTGLTVDVRIQDSSRFSVSNTAVSVVGTATSLLLPEFLIWSATTATGVADGVMWHDSGTGDMLVFSGGAERNMSDIGTGGEFLGPWTADHDAGAFDLTNIKFLEGRDTGGAGDFRIIFDAAEDSDSYFYDSATTDRINVQSGNVNVWAWEPTVNTSFINIDLFGGGTIGGIDGLFVESDNVSDLGTNTVRFRTGHFDNIDIQDDTSNPPDSGRHQISGSTTSLNIGAAVATDTISLWFAGVEKIEFQDDRISSVGTGALHNIQFNATNLAFTTENESDPILFQTGTGRTNVTAQLSDLSLLLLTETDDTQNYTVIIRQNHDTPANDRTIGDIVFQAEDTASNNQDYAIISSSSHIVTSGSEDGQLQLGPVSGGTLLGMFNLRGNNDATSDGGEMGFFGSNGTSKQTITGSRNSAALADLLTSLANMGLIVDSSSA